jgi:hypothetical protein
MRNMGSTTSTTERRHQPRASSPSPRASPTRPRSLPTRGEGRGEGQMLAPAVVGCVNPREGEAPTHRLLRGAWHPCVASLLTLDATYALRVPRHPASILAASCRHAWNRA